ncbi:MAG TPA: right-handed parallel beta-helix repeat-containing protein [Candidatus Babeliales bacterium]|nr:right-handed parallel beta-helix repeat-containing protein [Candidatus Babeliales bacterium]
MNYKKNMAVALGLLFSCAVYATDTAAKKDGSSTRASGAVIQSALCEILRKIDALSACDNACSATVITESQILSESGTYCLGNDVNGTIFIVGSGITLDLNGHTVFAGSDGIAVSDTASSVRIKNGYLKGNGFGKDTVAVDRGIFVNGAREVRIEDVMCEGWDLGIYCTNVSTLLLDHVMTNNNQTAGLFCENSSSALVRDSIFNRSAVGALVTDGSVVEFVNCLAAIDSQEHDQLRNTVITVGAGFLSDGASVVYRDCKASGTDIGFSFMQVSDIPSDSLRKGSVSNNRADFFNCVAEDNVTGFELHGDLATLTNCIAQGNSKAGFASYPDQGSVIFRNCVSKDNSVFGFTEGGMITTDISGPALNMYLNCVACNNLINYSDNIIAANNAPVRSAADASGFDNVDCSAEPV